MPAGMGRRTATGVLICAGLAATGCDNGADSDGGDAERTPRAVAERFIAAVTRGDTPSACRQFVPSSAEIWFGGPCHPDRPSMPPTFEAEFGNADVRSVRVSSAEARVVLQNDTAGERGLILRRTNDGWKIFNTSVGSRPARQDKVAIRNVNATAIALGGYSTDNGNSFAGASARNLRRYSMTVPLDAKVTSTRTTFELEIGSESGNVFRIRGNAGRGGIGLAGRTCEVAGVGRCSPAGRWR